MTTKSLFLSQANKFYQDWLKQNLNTENEDKLQFSNQWIKWSKSGSKNMEFPCTNQTSLFQYPKKIVL